MISSINGYNIYIDIIYDLFINDELNLYWFIDNLNNMINNLIA